MITSTDRSMKILCRAYSEGFIPSENETLEKNVSDAIDYLMDYFTDVKEYVLVESNSFTYTDRNGWETTVTGEFHTNPDMPVHAIVNSDAEVVWLYRAL